ncbi:MAG: methylmalonyl Co-A mutase-associated GTPase MeaB [Flammeovirgaceae bacterium]|jgi:LAO/AO transport system kinase|nr:methylmalonyl Co-A mutase-associated GTPase MeaB [Flammeovirgaceae bacterium]|tara:strand:+ start:16983 stop:17975 length:993 start_codon:yes stop_codon:yes gene_type:complete
MRFHKTNLSLEQYKSGLNAGDRLILSKAITLCESQLPEDELLASLLIEETLGQSEHSFRIGITGIPGVGKSTFIEAFGLYLIQQGHKVAVLSVDPTSSLNHGSILGDKTRMNELSLNRNAYIRPSPAGKQLGGIAEKTRENILLCEAAGFNVILIETVGVGQSETAVKHLSDFMILLMISGAGDELQGIKRGLMELADMVLINKSDGNNLKASKQTKTLIKQALHYFPANTNQWEIPVETISSIDQTGIDNVWKLIERYQKITKANHYFESNRNKQNLKWFQEGLSNQILRLFLKDPTLQAQKAEIESAIVQETLSVKSGIQQLMQSFKK